MMAIRPYWKGYLKLSLVTCSVSLTPATSEGEKIRFHTINKATGHRVRSRYVDSETGKTVPEKDEVKGYETEEGQHVIIEDEELEAVGLESTRTINVDQFVDGDTIDWIWYDQPYYLVPNDEVAQEAFAVIREAMAVTKTVGISRLVLSRRERAVLLEPRGKGIVLWTLRYGDEVRNSEDLFAEVEKEKVDTKLVTMLEKLIGDLTKPWDPAMMRDPVQAQLKKIIAAKKKQGGKARTEKADTESKRADNVIDLMSALKRSLEETPGKKRRS
jgi:DNA end-binding protein Ku